ncbi:MAG: FAD-binding protein [Bacteroidetes bacterium]|jgi:glycolate oxidase|nr:FAD-binding protein [Bacteroidota bacterium]MDA0903094.1 FAD-binding protein [Bacteroidota bacterium]MDA1243080.1 FAD-binding protein [Bacteroidota bacterium]
MEPTLAPFDELLQWLPAHRVHWSEQKRQAHASDETEDLAFMPDVVVEPENVEEVSAVMSWAHRHGIPVTAAGARTGLSGGALPVFGGIALSMLRMNRIVAIDTLNHQAVVEPGVITEELSNAAAQHGLMYAVDPASRGTCTIGGNVAENSGGPRAVKYGVTKDWILNLEVVLADGTVIETGANTLKNSTGYNLTQLMVGSEGTLGIVTKATLKLLPLPRHQALMLVPFTSAENACAAVAAIFQAGAMPSALEFMERDAILLAQQFTGVTEPALGPDDAAHLLVEVDGFVPEDLLPQCERILPVLEKHGAGEVLFAESAAEKDALWFLRRRVGEAVKAASTYKEEDTVVPRGELPRLLGKVKQLGETYGFRSVCYGHAGDGNLHINILRDDLDEAIWNERLPQAIRELFAEVVRLGGTLSGEHGIGYVQKNYMDLACNPAQLAVMRSIKDALDPKGILNPGKVFPDAG